MQLHAEERIAGWILVAASSVLFGWTVIRLGQIDQDGLAIYQILALVAFFLGCKLRQ